MKFLKIDMRDFSKYTLTNLFYKIKPIAIFSNGFKLKIVCYYETNEFKSLKYLKDIGTLKGWQEVYIKEKNNNFYTSFNI